MLFASLFQKASQPSAARAVQGYDLPPRLGSSQWVLFIFSPRGGLPSWGISNSHDDDAQKNCPNDILHRYLHLFPQNHPNPVFFEVCLQFWQCVPSRHGNLHIVTIKAFQNIFFYNVSICFPFPCLPKPLKTPLFTLFSSIFPGAGQLKHMYKKSFKNIVFTVSIYRVFKMFSVKNTVIFTFFGIKSVQNTGFCSVFNALASKNLSKYRYLQCFFIFVRFFIAGSPPKWPKIPFQYPLKLRHPKLVEKSRKHHLILVSVRNRVCTPPAKAWLFEPQ